MTEDDFLEVWQSERAMYEAWGQLVVEHVVGGINGRVLPLSADLFLRIPPKFRVKEDVSIVEKAFYRKNYDDPYSQITDKVGVRFVVLLNSDIKIVEDAINEGVLWETSKDRDFEEEQKSNPIKFDYAAKHFVVRCKANQDYNGVTIDEGSPCEIQVKTLLQHAYSELTHDTIYKPKVDATPEMLRAAAKSMALIEATNDYFEEVTGKVKLVTAPERALTEALAAIYFSNVGIAAQVSRLEGVILDALNVDEDDEAITKVAAMLEKFPYTGQQIAERAKTKLLYRQPSILLVYFFARHRSASIKEVWPLTDDELRPIFSDVGVSFG